MGPVGEFRLAWAGFWVEGELGQFVRSILSFALPITEHIHA